jgi:hypothetical protein
VYYRNDKKDVPQWLKQLYMFVNCKRAKGDIYPISTDLEKMKLSVFENDKNITIRRGSTDDKSNNAPKLTNLQLPSVSVSNEEKCALESIENTLARLTSEVEGNCSDNANVSWKNISYMIDGIAFVLFTFMSVCSFTVFFAITY